jgi:hypothetical protein
MFAECCPCQPSLILEHHNGYMQRCDLLVVMLLCKLLGGGQQLAHFGCEL